MISEKEKIETRDNYLTKKAEFLEKTTDQKNDFLIARLIISEKIDEKIIKLIKDRTRAILIKKNLDQNLDQIDQLQTEIKKLESLLIKTELNAVEKESFKNAMKNIISCLFSLRKYKMTSILTQIESLLGNVFSPNATSSTTLRQRIRLGNKKSRARYRID
jgi:hypothetical protein